MHPFLNTANTAAREAGKILLRGYDKLGHAHVEEKGKSVFADEIRQGIFGYIEETLKTAYPRHEVTMDQALTSTNSNNDSSKQTPDEDHHQWLIEPICGLNNFVRGIPEFALSMALIINGKPEYSLIYDPIREEVFTAIKGSSAQLNSTRMRVSKAADLSAALLIAPDFSQHLSGEISLRQSGCSALDLAYVAAGRADAIVEASIDLTELAAGSLMIREAGGLVSDFMGGENYLSTGKFIAGNPKLYKSLVQTLGTKLTS